MFPRNESEATTQRGLSRLPRSAADFRRKPLLWLGLFAPLIWLFSGCSAFAADSDDSLLVYAVNIHQTPMQTWGPGYGIYLGKGLFITAAHVAGHTWLTRPKVSIGGQEFPTSVVKAGDFETVDLTLLSVDERQLPLRLISPAKSAL